MILANKTSLKARLCEFAKNKKGTTAIMMAILTPFILSGLAFGTEYGYFQLSKRKLQNTADTAAFAAGTQLRSGLDEDGQRDAALIVAQESGFANGGSDIFLVQSPPLTGAFAGNSGAVRVSITQNFDRYFSGIFSSDDVPITSGATVLVQNGRPACVLSLNPSTSEAINVSGSTDVTLDGCDLAANSISASAIASNGNSANASADCITTVGGVDDPQGAYDLSGPDGCGSPIENAPVSADPYADIPEPSFNSGDCRPSSDLTRNNPRTDNDGVTCYRNVNIGSSDVVLESDHVYIFDDSTITINGNGSLVGDNVTIFLSGNSSLRINGNGTLDITAPTSGTYSGLGIFADRDEPIDLDLSGNNGVSVVGAIYAPNFGSDIDFTGNSSSFTAGQCTQVIGGGRIDFTGSSEFDTDCSNSGTTEILVAQSIDIVE